MTGIMAFMGLVVVAGIVTKTIYFLYYPMIVINKITVWSVLVYLSYGALCLLPVAINLTEDIKWHYWKSKI